MLGINNVPLVNCKVNCSKIIVGLLCMDDVVMNSLNILNFYLLGHDTNTLLTAINMKKMKKYI